MVEPRLIATKNGLLLALAFAAGYIDALSYLGLGHVFTANMTGNTVLLGIAFAEFDIGAIRRSGIALAGFLVGAAIGAWIVERDHSDSRWPRAVTYTLALESGILFTFAAFWYLIHDTAKTPTTTGTLIVLSALAMGLQSAAVIRLEITGIATTYLTGTLTNLAALLMGRSLRKSKPFHRSVMLAAVWIAYIGGAVIAAVDLPRNLMLALVLPATLIMTIVLIAAIVFRPR